MNKNFIVLLAIFAFCGCKNASESYINAMNQSLELIVPAHILYIKSDEKLSQLDKEAREKATQEVLFLSRKAAEEQQGGK